MTIKKAKTAGLRRVCKEKQQGTEILGNVFKLRRKLFKPSSSKKGFEIGLRVVNSPLRKKIIKEGIKETPAIYNAGVKRIKNNRIKSILESDPTNYAVKKVQGQIYNWQNA